MMTVLSKADWAFWEENGYVIIPNAVPQENLDRMVEAIWWFFGYGSRGFGDLV